VLYTPLWHPSLSGPVFNSVDDFQHTCTVTGAVWGSQGRTFDALDDLITVPDALSIQNIFDGGGTVLSWINPASDGEGDVGRICNKVGWDLYVRTQTGGTVYPFFEQGFSTTVGAWRWNNVAAIDTWGLLAMTYDNSSVANNPVFYFNEALEAVTEITAPVGTRTTDVGSDLIIGNIAVTTKTWDGIIGEVWGYNRVLTLAEIQRIYQATKWRYQ